MLEIYGNIFDRECDAICITTNGIVKNNNEAVMGAGIALQAKIKYPQLPLLLGQKIKTEGNHVCVFKFEEDKRFIVCFPTKNDWKDKSDISLIKQSLLELVIITNEYNWNKVCLPRPGCHNGQLNWNDVKKFVLKLDDRFCIVNL